MNKYRELADDHQRRVSAFLNKYAFFAFNDQQFADGLQQLGIAREDAGKMLVRMSGTGGFMLKDKVAEYGMLADAIAKETADAIHDPATGPEFAYQMFYDELANHEYGYTGDLRDTLDALGYTIDEVLADEILCNALDRARKELLS